MCSEQLAQRQDESVPKLIIVVTSAAEPVVTEESETGEIDGSGFGLEGSYLPPGGGSVGLGTKPQVGQIGSSDGVVSSTAGNNIGLTTPTTNNPTHGGSSGGSQNRKYLLISMLHNNSFVVVINQYLTFIISLI